MEKSLLIGGFGGQGVQTIGKLITLAANNAEKHVTFFPAYGGEMRGGTSNCTVVVSNEEIGSPSRQLLDYVIALNIPSFKRFQQRVKEGGYFIVNSSLIKEKSDRDDMNVVEVPVNDIANEIGSSKVINIVMLGFFIRLTGILPVDVVRETVIDVLGKKKEFLELNKKAFDTGAAAAEEYLEK